MDASLPKGKETGGAEMVQPLIKEEKFTKSGGSSDGYGIKVPKV